VSGIQDKVIAITGASSGIGSATALLLAERGGSVVLGARRTGRLDELAQQNELGIAPEAVARAIAFAIEQPDEVEIRT